MYNYNVCDPVVILWVPLGDPVVSLGYLEGSAWVL